MTTALDVLDICESLSDIDEGKDKEERPTSGKLWIGDKHFRLKNVNYGKCGKATGTIKWRCVNAKAAGHKVGERISFKASDLGKDRDE